MGAISRSTINVQKRFKAKLKTNTAYKILEKEFDILLKV